MVSNILSVGNKIELKKINQNFFDQFEVSSGANQVYHSQIYDINEDGRLKVGMPIEGGKVIPLSIDSKLDACFYTSAGLYQSRILVVDRYKEGNLYIMEIELLSELQKYQRRQFYRLSCTIDIKYRVFGETEIEEYNKAEDLAEKEAIVTREPLKPAIILDISGGGVRIVSNEKHEKGDVVFMHLQIAYGGKEREYGLLGNVIRSATVKDIAGKYEHRIEYRNIKGSTREELIKFIFEEERKRRQREISEEY